MISQLLERLLDISRQLAENRKLDVLLEYAMDVALELFNAEYGYLILLDDDGELDFRVRRARDGQELENPEEQISQTIFNRVVRNRKDLIIANAMADPIFREASSVRALQIQSVMCVPLLSRGKVVGAIYLENRSRGSIFTTEDLSPLKLFAAQAAVAIENAALNDELEARVAARTVELEQAMEQLEQNWREVVESNHYRTEFLTKVTHEIRSPLNTVLMAQQLLVDGRFGELNANQHEWVDTSIEMLTHIIKLTEDFFDLTLMQMGKLSINPELVDTKEFLLRLYEVGQVMPWSDGVAFDLVLVSDLPPLMLDKTRIQQVLINLMANALRFTKQGEVILYARLTEDRESVLIGVRDTGIGVPPDELDKIFERFQQESTTGARSPGGGLGLAICKELVELHGGRIWAESRIGYGSDFKFLLPAKR